jgi:hypothetical protein
MQKPIVLDTQRIDSAHGCSDDNRRPNGRAYELVRARR